MMKDLDLAAGLQSLVGLLAIAAILAWLFVQALVWFAMRFQDGDNDAD